MNAGRVNRTIGGAHGAGSAIARAAAELRSAPLTMRMGIIRGVHGLAVQASGPRARIGELCAIVPPGVAPPLDVQALLIDSPAGADATAAARKPTIAEVIGIQSSHVMLMPYGDVRGVEVGSTVVALGERSEIGVGSELLGRVIDGFGQPLDGLPPPATRASRAVHGQPINPMDRPPIDTVLETGVRVIDGLLTVGRGQRVGIFAGSGVGKSTLLGMIARHVQADVNVIALIGERGREVRDFIERQLGSDGLRRSVVVVATADQPALARIRAAHAAFAIAESFRDAGLQVVLTVDSITRLAMARREVGLSAGEPPTARGYPPSVFAELPRLCERCGTASSGGTMTALLTVLVEGDDFNEPVSDTLRAVLDGHIVLSRDIANAGRYPAVDVLKSASRLLTELTSPAERELIRESVRLLELLERNRQMVELGAYERGTNPTLDAALGVQTELDAWLRQDNGGDTRQQALDALRAILTPREREAPDAADKGRAFAIRGAASPARIVS
ncbi:FliI/YscN family ATPase [Trinickia diaoshuihuensis]|jgi:flagellum-specific ATP synthase|uniref:FliI/YscN family ATPase n=1 Tax=Trinickia diaoshuihuensis TaxID=2292265 RepID=UPI000E242DBE|nr:FliI/YscN family ATPase [Trinickia diaoshuihuensis]